MSELSFLCRRHFPQAHIAVHRDYAQLERFIAVENRPCYAQR